MKNKSCLDCGPDLKKVQSVSTQKRNTWIHACIFYLIAFLFSVNVGTYKVSCCPKNFWIFFFLTASSIINVCCCVNQGISWTCQRPFLLIEGSLSHCYCWQQPLQFLAATIEWDTLCSFFCWTTLWWTGLFFFSIFVGSKIIYSLMHLKTTNAFRDVSAHQRSSSAPQTSIYTERRPASATREISHAGVVSKAWYPSIHPTCMKWMKLFS